MITLSMLSDATTANHFNDTCSIKSNLTKGSHNVKMQQKDMLILSFNNHNEEHISTRDKYKYGQEMHSTPIQKPCTKYSSSTNFTMNDNIPKPSKGRTVTKCSCITI